MKQIGLIILLCFFTIRVSSQNEIPADSIRSMDMPATKDFDGFLLDMNLMKMAAPQMPRLTLDIPDASKDYSFLFHMDPNVIYSQGYSHIFSLGNSTIYSMNPFGLTGFGSSPQNLQMGSFRLKNGMRINTYGEYDKDGRKVHNPSALPWERNNFKGAFELKSANGSFGIRIEVQQGKTGPY
ncbi:occludin [Bacteroides oleiciplenus]|uniref:occludin n=1 Tax=Bacteroides oleiciplenus TaxID=626931 RepID=UPI0026DB5F2E|nr:occludin [Bacteroides oleiciplenus]